VLTEKGCQVRRQRLLKQMEANSWDAFLTADRRTTYYLTGYLGPADFPVLFILWSDARTALVSAAISPEYADEMVQLEGYSIQRPIDFLEHDGAAALADLLGKNKNTGAARWALEKSSVSVLQEDALRKAHPNAELFDASKTLVRLRKRKEEDEIACLKENLKYCAVAYDAARAVIKPGITELDVFNAMQAAIVKVAGTSVDFPGDFACGERGIAEGGPPTSRKLQSGDLYILDLRPAANPYYADTCRTFIVGEPTALQRQAWEITMEAVRLAESMVKPGVLARDVYREIKTFLDSEEISEKSFFHHVGHGIGHRSHEAPRIIPGTDDVFEEGDVFTIEPGMYTKALHGGIRLEDNYVLRSNGPEDLFDYPWGL
jgi:Xaa-Pro dipeptidase